MFSKFKKWILSQKIVTFFNWKNRHQRKIKSFLNNGLGFSKIINIENQSWLLNVFSLKEIEDLIYQEYRKNITKQPFSKINQSKKTNNRLQEFGIRFSQEKIEIINQKVIKEFYLQQERKSQSKVLKVFKLFFPNYKTATEKFYLAEINKLNQKEKAVLEIQEAKTITKNTSKLKSILKKQSTNKSLRLIQQEDWDMVTERNTNLNQQPIKFEPLATIKENYDQEQASKNFLELGF